MVGPGGRVYQVLPGQGGDDNVTGRDRQPWSDQGGLRKTPWPQDNVGLAGWVYRLPEGPSLATPHLLDEWSWGLGGGGGSDGKPWGSATATMAKASRGVGERQLEGENLQPGGVSPFPIPRRWQGQERDPTLGLARLCPTTGLCFPPLCAGRKAHALPSPWHLKVRATVLGGPAHAPTPQAPTRFPPAAS